MIQVGIQGTVLVRSVICVVILEQFENYLSRERADKTTGRFNLVGHLELNHSILGGDTEVSGLVAQRTAPLLGDRETVSIQELLK